MSGHCVAVRRRMNNSVRMIAAAVAVAIAQIVWICAATADTTVAAVVAVAVIISHDFADGLNTYTVTSSYGNSRRRALILLACDAVALVTGATITLAFVIPRHMPGLYLRCFAGILLYLTNSLYAAVRSRLAGPTASASFSATASRSACRCASSSCKALAIAAACSLQPPSSQPRPAQPGPSRPSLMSRASCGCSRRRASGCWRSS
jgi:hypothetical protein